MTQEPHLFGNWTLSWKYKVLKALADLPFSQGQLLLLMAIFCFLFGLVIGLKNGTIIASKNMNPNIYEAAYEGCKRGQKLSASNPEDQGKLAECRAIGWEIKRK